jgi:dTDP-glucose pyrophosphorylase
MWAVIPAAGRATRMKEAGEATPKALLRVGGRPLVAWLLDRLGPRVTDVCLIVPPDPAVAARTRKALVRVAGERSVHCVIQPDPLGAGDAVLRAGGLVRGPCVVAMGDGFYDRSLEPALDAWSVSGTEGAVLVERPRSAVTEPVGWVRTEGTRILCTYKSLERGSARCRLAGLVVFPESVFSLERLVPSPDTGEVELEQLVMKLLEEGAIFRALTYDGWRRNVNHIRDLHMIMNHLGRRAGVSEIGEVDEGSGSRT